MPIQGGPWTNYDCMRHTHLLTPVGLGVSRAEDQARMPDTGDRAEAPRHGWQSEKGAVEGD
ncbi:MAG TPA: hypothetical protein VH593_29025 [Ktedonobacteraceae bacterium]